MRQGYTLIELLLVILIFGIVTSSAISSYSSSQERVAFHQTIQQMQRMINDMRGRSISEGDSEYVVLFHFRDTQEVISFENQDANPFAYSSVSDSAPYESLELQPSDINDRYVSPAKKYVLNSGVWGSPINPKDVAIVFSPPNGECTFALDGVETDTDVMLQIGFAHNGETNPSRYLYLHKKEIGRASCRERV